MNRIIIQKGEKLYLDLNIDYTIYVDTYVNINNKVYFTDSDNFFHFKNNGIKSPTFFEEIDLLINNFKNIFNNCHINASTQTQEINLEKPNVYTMESKDKFIVELPKDTIIKMNDIPITLAVNTFFEIKQDTKFIIPEYSNIEIISRNNIYNISNREKINVKYSKLI
jgi:hypothetical protein